jgi:hypothetical protein
VCIVMLLQLATFEENVLAECVRGMSNPVARYVQLCAIRTKRMYVEGYAEKYTYTNTCIHNAACTCVFESFCKCVHATVMR